MRMEKVQPLLICFFTVFHCRRGGGGVGAGWRVKDAGLTSLVRQPVGLDGIHWLRRRLLHNSLRSHPSAAPCTCSHSQSQFLPSLSRQLVPPLPFLPTAFPFFLSVMWKGDGWTCGGAERNLFGLVCQPIFIKRRRGIFSCYASLL